MKAKIEIVNKDNEQMLVSYKEAKIEKIYIVTSKGDKVSIKKKKDIFFFFEMFLLLALIIGIAVCVVGIILMIVTNDLIFTDAFAAMMVIVMLSGFIWILEVRPKKCVLKYIKRSNNYEKRIR